jgi:hypothetical protein
MTLETFLLLMKQVDKEPWDEVLKREPCVYCCRLAAEVPGGEGRKWRVGGATKMTIEHVVPRGLGIERPPGWMNRAPACWNCNHERGSMPLLAYLVYRLEASLRFKPGPNNARNRAWKAVRQAQRARRQQMRTLSPRPLTFTLAELENQR